MLLLFFSCNIIMFIKAIVLDGFKSYAQRTEVNAFDPLFNAVTGLNGSGKSNILDGICFVLGITNLSQVTIIYLVFYLPYYLGEYIGSKRGAVHIMPVKLLTTYCMT